MPRDTDSSIIHVDPDALIDVTATKENPSTRLRVFHSVVDQVAQDGAEKQRVAVNRGGGLWTMRRRTPFRKAAISLS